MAKPRPVTTLKAATQENRPTEITTRMDPTSTPPEFALLASDSTEAPEFFPGEYAGTWDTETGNVDALSPLVGSDQTLDVTAGNTYFHLVRWTAGIERPIRHFENLRFI